MHIRGSCDCDVPPLSGIVWSSSIHKICWLSSNATQEVARCRGHPLRGRGWEKRVFSVRKLKEGVATHIDLLLISPRNIHCRGGRRSEEPLSLEVALAHFKEKEREKKLAVAASRIGEMVSSKEGKKPKHGSSGEL